MTPKQANEFLMRLFNEYGARIVKIERTAFVHRHRVDIQVLAGKRLLTGARAFGVFRGYGATSVRKGKGFVVAGFVSPSKEQAEELAKAVEETARKQRRLWPRLKAFFKRMT